MTRPGATTTPELVEPKSVPSGSKIYRALEMRTRAAGHREPGNEFVRDWIAAEDALTREEFANYARLVRQNDAYLAAVQS